MLYIENGFSIDILYIQENTIKYAIIVSMMILLLSTSYVKSIFLQTAGFSVPPHGTIEADYT